MQDATVKVVLALTAVALAAVVTQAARQASTAPPGAAFFMRGLAGNSDRREARPDILDTPVLPGSVIKAVTLVAALESQVIEPETARLCRRTVTVEGRRYVCSHPDLKRPLTPAEALAYSCNDYFVSLATRLPRGTLNAVRQRAGLAPIPADANYAAALIGLDGPRVTPRALLDVISRLAGVDRDRPMPMAEATRRVLREGLAGAARYGTASALNARGLTALAKTGTAPMPGGSFLGIAVALEPAAAPTRGIVVVTPGAAGLDAASVAADLLSAPAVAQTPAPRQVQAPPRAAQTPVPAIDDTRVRIGTSVAGGSPKVVANWVNGELSALMNEMDVDFGGLAVSAQQLGDLVARIHDGKISTKAGKEVLHALAAREGDVDAIIARRGLEQISDAGAIEAAVEAAIGANPRLVADYRSGREKAFNALVGKVMAATQGKADPVQVNEALRRRLSSS